jgi:hypothetical protein
LPETDAAGAGAGAAGGMHTSYIVSQNTASRIGGKKKKGKKLSGSSSSLTLKEEFQLLVFLLQYPTSPLTSLS